MKRLGIAALIVCAWANTAIAEDYDWSGLYGGVSIGGRLDDLDRSSYRGYGNWADDQISIDGISAGIFAGYNFRIANFVVGPDISAQFGKRGEWFSDDDAGAKKGKIKTGAAFDFNARFGPSVGSWLPYLTGGYSNTRIGVPDMSFDYGRQDRTTNRNISGWNIGAGVDAVIYNDMFVRAEYKFRRFSEREIEDQPVSLKQHSLSFGIGYKF